MPRHRVPRLTEHVASLCEEAGMPRFDETTYDVLRDAVFFVWDEPRFCVGASTGTSIYSMKAEDLAGAWTRKFGDAHPLRPAPPDARDAA